MNKSVCLFQISPSPFRIFCHQNGREANNQHTRDKHTKRDSEMKSPNPEPNKENTSETSNWQEYWIRERQEKKPKARPLHQHWRQRRTMEGKKKKGVKGKMERRRREHLRNTGRGKLLIEAKGWRRRVWIVFWEVSLDESSARDVCLLYMCVGSSPILTTGFYGIREFPSTPTSFVPLEDLFKQVSEQRTDPRLLPINPTRRLQFQ